VRLLIWAVLGDRVPRDRPPDLGAAAAASDNRTFDANDIALVMVSGFPRVELVLE
jgi:hypothetical protein